MVHRKKVKEERKRDREIVKLNHQKVTEEALEPLFEKKKLNTKGLSIV